MPTIIRTHVLTYYYVIEKVRTNYKIQYTTVYCNYLLFMQHMAKVTKHLPYVNSLHRIDGELASGRRNIRQLRHIHCEHTVLE